MPLSATEMAISILCNNMRIYGETQMRFGNLVKIDREEALNNLDRAFEAKLEAFHTLYDLTNKQFAYLDHPDTLALIVMRNAIHHRDHTLFRSLFSDLWLDGDPERRLGASFLLAKHRTAHGGPSIMTHYYKIDDFRTRLDPVEATFPGKKATKQKSVQQLAKLEEGLSFAKIRAHANQHRYPMDQVYVDLIPIFISATVRTFKALRDAGIEFKGFDADVYKTPFTSELAIDLESIEFNKFTVGPTYHPGRDR